MTIEVKALGWADQSGFQKNDHDNAEPYQVDPHGLQHRHQDGHGRHHHRQGFHEGAQDEIKDHQEDHEGHRGQIHARHPGRHLRRNAQIEQRELSRNAEVTPSMIIAEVRTVVSKVSRSICQLICPQFRAAS